MAAVVESKQFFDCIQKNADAKLVESLAGLQLECPAEALASTIKMGPQIADRLDGMDLKAIESAASLSGPRGEDGTRIRNELFEAFANHEYAAPLLATYDRVSRRAVELMAEEIKSKKPEPPAPQPKKPTPEAAKSSRPSSNRSQIKGDAMPEGISDSHAEIIFSYVEVSCDGQMKPLWVSKNLEAMILADGAARYDEANKMLVLPNLNWKGTLDS